MSQPVHTPGPLFTDDSDVMAHVAGRDTLAICKHGEGTIPEIVAVAYRGYEDGPSYANARLLAAAYNAFDSAARQLNVSAVELAERMQDGGIFDLVRFADKMLDYWTNEECPHHIDDLKANLRAILAKVNGGAA